MLALAQVQEVPVPRRTSSAPRHPQRKHSNISSSSAATSTSLASSSSSSSTTVSNSGPSTRPAPPPPPKLTRIPTPPPQDAEISAKVDIHSYPTADLLRLLASLLTQIAVTNDKLDAMAAASSPTEEHGPIWDTLTTASRTALATPTSTLTFHARNIPVITLEAYLLRILKYCPTTNEVFLSLLVYFDRMSKLCSEATSRTFVIDSYNIHRLVIAGVTVASKFFSDVFYTNSRYAKVGGLPLQELNQLELQFLLLNNFNLVIPPSEMQRYAEQLILFSKTNKLPTIAPQLSPSPSTPASSSQSQSTHYSRIYPPAQGVPETQTANANTYPRMERHPLSPPSSSGSTHTQHPLAADMAAMGAVDAYGGRIPGSQPKSVTAPLYQNNVHPLYPPSLRSAPAVPLSTPGSTSYVNGINPPQSAPASSTTSYLQSRSHLANSSSANPNSNHVMTFSSSSRPIPRPRSYSTASSSSADVETETETETEAETDGGWTTDDEPTIRPGQGTGAGEGSGDSIYSGRSDVSLESEGSDADADDDEADSDTDDESLIRDRDGDGMDIEDPGHDRRKSAPITDQEKTPERSALRGGERTPHGLGIGIDDGDEITGSGTSRDRDEFSMACSP